MRQSIGPELRLIVCPEAPAMNSPFSATDSTSASSAQFLTSVQKLQAKSLGTAHSIENSKRQTGATAHLEESGASTYARTRPFLVVHPISIKGQVTSGLSPDSERPELLRASEWQEFRSQCTMITTISTTNATTMSASSGLVRRPAAKFCCTSADLAARLASSWSESDGMALRTCSGL